MLFGSFNFLILVILTFVLYYSTRIKRLQISILITSSIIFYGYQQPKLLLLLILILLINSTISYYTFRNQTNSKKIVVCGVALNLLVLIFFKFNALLTEHLFDAEQSTFNILLSLPLPIGISFYTFQGISLMVDTYKGDNKPSGKSLISQLHDSFLFIIFFPQLIAGPIVKAKEFIPQIETKLVKNINWEFCFKALVQGYFLKLVIADNLNECTFGIQYPLFLTNTSFTLIFLLFGYSIQIFSDFAGYSLIAIGISGLFGYTIPQNFKMPYIASSFSEFWKRWHITLSNFLKEYLYIPMGGNRKGEYKTYFFILITMILGGIWHGVSEGFILWGSAHGVALIIERYIKNRIPLKSTLINRILGGSLVFTFVTTSWLLFKLTDLSHFVAYFSTIKNNWPLEENRYQLQILTFIMLYSIPVILYHIKIFRENLVKKKIDFLVYGILIFLIILNTEKSVPFVYFQF